MYCQYLTKLWLFLVCFWSLGFQSSLLAEIIPDSSLGNETSIITPDVVIEDKLADLIEGGAIRDNNLFHSFEKFNVPLGDNIYFASPDGIDNILTRVTGNNISEIFGTLGVNGGANLFLLNPNGISFGRSAALDLNGSFLATTADSYIFQNNFEYSASDLKSPPLLTVNLPVGLQMGNNPKPILNRSRFSQHGDAIAGLKIPFQKTLSLIGGEVGLEGGHLSTTAGNLEIGAVGEHSTVSLLPILAVGT